MYINFIINLETESEYSSFTSKHGQNIQIKVLQDSLCPIGATKPHNFSQLFVVFFADEPDTKSITACKET